MSRCCRSMAFFPASNFIFQSPTDISNETHHFPSLSSCLPSFSSQDFHGKRSVPFTGIVLGDPQPDNNNGGFGGEDELSDDGSHLLGSGEKKRRLNMDQVRTLEKNFELGNKLEPERKMQLAKSLGLEPRQIAIWFQNRRARWKTKQLEKDYESLKRQFHALKSDNDTLLALNRKLQSQIMALKGREPTESINLNKDTEGSSSNRSDNTSDIKLDISRTPTSAATAAFTAARVDSPVDISGGGPSMALFPTSSSMRPNGPVAQLFQSPHPRPADHHHHHHNHHHNSSFSNMFCAGIDDQTEFWPWIDQQNFN